MIVRCQDHDITPGIEVSQGDHWQYDVDVDMQSLPPPLDHISKDDDDDIIQVQDLDGDDAVGCSGRSDDDSLVCTHVMSAVIYKFWFKFRWTWWSLTR